LTIFQRYTHANISIRPSNDFKPIDPYLHFSILNSPQSRLFIFADDFRFYKNTRTANLINSNRQPRLAIALKYSSKLIDLDQFHHTKICQQLLRDSYILWANRQVGFWLDDNSILSARVLIDRWLVSYLGKIITLSNPQTFNRLHKINIRSIQ